MPPSTKGLVEHMSSSSTIGKSILSIGSLLEGNKSNRSYRQLEPASAMWENPKAQSLAVTIMEQEERLHLLEKRGEEAKSFVAARFDSNNPVAIALTMKQYLKINAQRTHARRTVEALRLILAKVEDGELFDFQPEVENILKLPMQSLETRLETKDLVQAAKQLVAEDKLDKSWKEFSAGWKTSSEFAPRPALPSPRRQSNTPCAA